MNLVLLGPPGAGKGTQATRACQEFSLRHLSSGDILRAERKAMSELGRRAQDYMDRGVLVPDDLILSMMMDHIARPEAAHGFLLDGFPRTEVQARGLDERLAAAGRKIDHVVDIQVSDEEVARRITGRWSCPKDGRVYHETFSPPNRAGACNECGEKLIRRKDDEPEVVRQRLRTYHEQTAPLASYYRNKGLLRPVDGELGADRVFAEIRRICQAS